MSKELDYDNLSEEDKDWLRNRSWGHLIPDESPAVSVPGPVFKHDTSREEQLQAVPNTGTVDTLGAGERLSRSPSGELYSQDDYESWKVADLKEEIESRNAERGDDEQISLDGKKADLVAALVADDEAGSAPADDGSDSDEPDEESSDEDE